MHWVPGHQSVRALIRNRLEVVVVVGDRLRDRKLPSQCRQWMFMYVVLPSPPPLVAQLDTQIDVPDCLPELNLKPVQLFRRHHSRLDKVLKYAELRAWR